MREREREREREKERDEKKKQGNGSIHPILNFTNTIPPRHQKATSWVCCKTVHSFLMTNKLSGTALSKKSVSEKKNLSMFQRYTEESEHELAKTFDEGIEVKSSTRSWCPVYSTMKTFKTNRGQVFSITEVPT